ncbi:Uncharacterized protein LACOL_1030 [Paucilactobacillus oligofermentans DSM 15707 = LMG 22743]|uniref:hypothetical protein n=1 Tax=Paucilactobacillus oligofermentans TaxID=293371 RepID=UPI00078EE375|nr:hypothetical protein [Paucilactobacillus oligofermentans]CUS26338.1 Uncharacterized protein LACOL_1030 [Paucilactobacillus oligofermentans DSM 15707 = LMG 22743]
MKMMKLKNNSITESEIGIEIGKLLNSGGNIATEGVQPEGVKRSNQQLSKEVNVENSSDNDVDVVSGASEN